MSVWLTYVLSRGTPTTQQQQMLARIKSRNIILKTEEAK